MTDINIDVKGLDEVIQKLQRFPKKLNEEMKDRMGASLDALMENVPEYPPPPPMSKYRRTGTLGSSLKSKTPNTVYSIKGSGANTEGRFGTKVSYAKYVIDPQQQAYMHRGRWWTMYVIRDRAYAKIKQIWADLVRIVKSKIGL